MTRLWPEIEFLSHKRRKPPDHNVNSRGATVWRNRIEIHGSGDLPTEAWQSLLDQLKAEHVPSLTPLGYRFAMVVRSTGPVATIYRTHSMTDEEIIEAVKVLQKFGLATRIGFHSS